PLSLHDALPISPRSARAHRRLAAVAARAAVGLPVPSALPLPLRTVPGRAAPARRPRAGGASGCLPPAVGHEGRRGRQALDRAPWRRSMSGNENLVELDHLTKHF